MYNDIYSYKPPKAQITLVQVLTIAVTVIVTLVIPMELISYDREANYLPYSAAAISAREQEQNQSQSAGRVAGTQIENSSVIYIPGLNVSIDLSSEVSLLTIGGGAMVTASAALLLYLQLNKKPAKAKK